MIKKEELRIGNLLLSSDNSIIKVSQIGGDGYIVAFQGVNDSYEDAVWEYDLDDIESDKPKPIPLTEEILLKCGFIKSNSNDNYERFIYSIQISDLTSLYYDIHKDWLRDDLLVEWYFSHQWNNNHFKNNIGWNSPIYLHQLQNLIYALTSEELKIEL